MPQRHSDRGHCRHESRDSERRFARGEDWLGGRAGSHRHGRHGGGRERQSGRFLEHGDLRFVILDLIAAKPRHGYEIIKAIEERSSGFYSPSPGMVYPALTYLEELGHASVEVEGTRKLYRITDAGRAHLAENRELVDTMFRQLKWIGEKMGQFRSAFTDDDQAAWTSRLREARRRLREAIVDARGASVEEQQRVAEILERAAEEIRKR